ncbi:phytoene/squalene synthase family protein [Staphylococcus petrasii]|uniref:phytoene/squalene synthase family protein n=1 Tax=Staphylococcus petrasii TaxID=1276936 RepID=UPI000CD28002|nr:phytoene/squalene synthase family protein [Staphylococcus petrasii]PNZ84208.1 dehydrosqualene synthase [Staphylococcus petrasii]TGA81604.1 phytoene/squalene synthase family protein [Staphylococcus petrasii]SUM59091.1 squalene desaturase [Staphylococcus petrasii]
MRTIEESYQYCHQIMKEYSKSFSYAFDMLPEQQRQAVWAIYAVCRIVDDSIDIHQDVEYLHKIRRDVQLIENHASIPETFESDEQIMLAFADTSKHFQMNYQALYDLIDTVEADQHFEMFETDQGLLDYCYGVAGTVGVLLIPILSTPPTQEAYDNGKQLGEALQLTNILRDVGEDYRNGRIYFSIERLNEFDVSIEKEIERDKPSENYQRIWEFYAKLADDNYDAVLNNLEVYNKESRMIIELAAEVYRGILNEVRKADYTLDKRVYVSTWKKNKIYRSLKKKYKA